MKFSTILRKSLPLWAFLMQYIMPVVLFGNVVPYTHGAVKAGFTFAGIIALSVVAFILSRKFKEWVKTKPKSTIRAIILSIFPVVIWFIVFIAVNKFVEFANSILHYWEWVIVFIAIGRIIYIIDETLCEQERKEREATNNGTGEQEHTESTE